MLTEGKQSGEGNSKKVKQLSEQGFEAMPDFPTVEIYVADDHKEMDTADGNWWVNHKQIHWWLQ